MPFVRRKQIDRRTPERAVAVLGHDDFIRRIARTNAFDELGSAAAGQADPVRVSPPQVLLSECWAQNNLVIDRAHKDDEEVCLPRRRNQ
jgi:hypothetical protein